MQGGAHGPHIRNNGGWVKYSFGCRGLGLWMGHLSPPAQTGSGQNLGGNSGKPTHGEDNSQSENHLLELSPYDIGVISPMTLAVHFMPLGVVPIPSGVSPIGGGLACEPAKRAQ